MAIIAAAHLSAELPSDADSTAIANAITQASDLVNAWATKYVTFPDVTQAGVLQSPGSAVRYCIQLAKVLYYQSIGWVSRDGQEEPKWERQIDAIKKTLAEIDIEPTIVSTAVGINQTYGTQLIARGQNILRWHPQCRIDSGTTPAGLWVQGFHWDIRKGKDYNDEDLNAWYLEAETYKATIEGTFYYARSWRADALDYQKYFRSHKTTYFHDELK